MNKLKKVLRMPLKLGFFKKITVHILLMTLITGVSITAATAYQFRRDIYRLEFDSAYMVYAAAVNYLTAHYYSRQAYVERSIDFVMRHKFMQLDESDSHAISHRPQQMIIYDDNGEIIYGYLEDPLQAPAQSLPPEALPDIPVLDYLPAENVIRIAGPISMEERGAPGSLVLYVPTTIRQQLSTLLIRSLLILAFVLSATVVLSLLFTRQVLSPIRALTSAARSVHRGDLSQRVNTITDDEIGELADTFNEMVHSLDRRMDFMHRMQEWTVRIGRQLDTQKLFEALGEMFERMTMADSYRLYLRDADTESLMVRLEYGAEGLPPPEEDKLTRMALKERWTMYLKDDGTADNEPTDVSELAIPLLSGKHRVGVIRIGRKSDRSLYDDDTLTILQTLAQHASVAIDNANLYERVAAQERMAQEMTLARQIQQSMLPREAPVIPGYEIVGGSAPALEVGGDYFDYVSRNGHCYMLIGDVSGKGVPAALIMSIVRALIHTYLEFETSPGRVLCQVNRNISADLDPEMFVTLSTLMLDPKQHQLLVARAGHEPALIVHEDGTVDHVAPRGTALGMLEVDDFNDMLEEGRWPLRERDTVLLYTDGITEAQNVDREEFGYERLEAIVRGHATLPVRELYERIIDELHQFTVGMAQSDDITLVILRRTGTN